MIDDDLCKLAEGLLEALRAKGMTLATAESCTGGLIAGTLTAIAGSSDVVFGGFVTYANRAKTEMIDVPADLIETHGAVSEPVARAMAEGVRRTAKVDLAIAVTGVAGPGGGSEEKPVGLVHFGLATPAGTRQLEMRFGDIGRTAIRRESVRTALTMVIEAAQP